MYLRKLQLSNVHLLLNTVTSQQSQPPVCDTFEMCRKTRVCWRIVEENTCLLKKTRVCWRKHVFVATSFIVIVLLFHRKWWETCFSVSLFLVTHFVVWGIVVRVLWSPSSLDWYSVFSVGFVISVVLTHCSYRGMRHRFCYSRWNAGRSLTG